MKNLLVLFMILLCNSANSAGLYVKHLDIEEKMETLDLYKTLPDISFFNNEGKKISFDEYDGKILIIYFWATWCMECRNELKSLDNLQKRFRKTPLEIVAVSIDYKNTEAIEKYYKSYGIDNLKIYYDHKASLYNLFSFYNLPITMFVEKDGKIIGYVKGAIDWDCLGPKEWLSELIEPTNLP